jgi:SAM-dependent methyltransferase
VSATLHGEYDDAALYDAENGWGPDDDFYRALAAESGGPILDLACGTGRLARALARDGHRVVGLDLAESMVARARQLDPAGAVAWQVGDAAHFELGQRFRLIVMTAHAFQHLIGGAAQEALFAAVARHLAADGIFAFETRNPGRQDYADGTGFKFWRRFTDPARGPVEVWVASSFDAPSAVDHVTLVRRFADGTERRSEARLQFTDAATLDARLAVAGLVCDRRYGDFGGEAFGPDSPEIVTVARPSPGSLVRATLSRRR